MLVYLLLSPLSL